jgi:hypothetical protein
MFRCDLEGFLLSFYARASRVDRKTLDIEFSFAAFLVLSSARKVHAPARSDDDAQNCYR